MRARKKVHDYESVQDTLDSFPDTGNYRVIGSFKKLDEVGKEYDQNELDDLLEDDSIDHYHISVNYGEDSKISIRGDFLGPIPLLSLKGDLELENSEQLRQILEEDDYDWK